MHIWEHERSGGEAFSAAHAMQKHWEQNNGVVVDTAEFDDMDMLYAAFEKAASQSRYLLIRNSMRDRWVEQVLQWFLERGKYLLERYDTELSNGCAQTWIQFRELPYEQAQQGYAALQSAYSKDYYMHDCGGYEVFQKSGGLEIEPRLADVYYLVRPVADDRILDIGCGRGELSYTMSRSGAEVTGIDYSEDAIQLALETYPDCPANLKYKQADIFQVNNLGCYDKVVIADVVEHMEQPVLERIFDRLAASLSPQGLLVIHTSPNRDFYQIRYPQMRREALALGCWLPKEPRSYYEKKMHINEQSPAALRAALEARFSCVRVWTGSVTEIDVEKTQEESCRDREIFALASKDEAVLNMRVMELTAPPVYENSAAVLSVADVCLERGVSAATVKVSILNCGNELISSRRKHPICLAYRISDQDGTLLYDRGEWTMITEFIRPSEEQTVDLHISVPEPLDRGKVYTVTVTLVADQYFWFDQEGNSRGKFALTLL